MHSYLSNRKQRVKINDTYSCWSEILFGVPQGSILGPLLFNIFICDMFYFLEGFDIANYTDDSTPYCASKNAESVVNNLEQSSTIHFKWLNNNYMKVNTGKSHLLLSGNSRATATIDNSYFESEYKKYLQESKSKVKCPCKNRSLHEHTEEKNNHEVFCNFSI